MPRPIAPASREAFCAFTQAVWEMRQLQSELLATPPTRRTLDQMRRAQEAESRVDRMLDGRPAPAPQGRLIP